MDLLTMPPTAHQLRAALARLDPGVDRAAAALHLALPVGAVAADTRLDDDGWRVWRTSRATGRDPILVAAAVAAGGWRHGDRAVDLTGPSAGWVKPHPVGSRVELVGVDVLFDGPVVHADSDVPTSVYPQLIAAAATGAAVPLLLGGTDGPVVVDPAGPGRWRAALLARSRIPDADLDAAAATLAARCGAAAWTVTGDCVALAVDGGAVHVPVDGDEGTVRFASAPLWWDRPGDGWRALGVDDSGRVWLDHPTGVRGWWEPTGR